MFFSLPLYTHLSPNFRKNKPKDRYVGFISIKVAATDIRYFARIKFSRRLVHRKVGEKSQATIILDKFVNKP